MKTSLPVGFAAVLVLALYSTAGAQTHGRMSAGLRAPSREHARVVTLSRSASQSTNGFIVVSDPSVLSLASFAHGAFPVPGLGFDFVHFAAVHRSFGTSALITTPLEPIIPIGLPFFAAPIETAPLVIVVQQPPVVIMQQPAVQEASYDVVPRSRSIELDKETAAMPQAAPEPDASEFVLARRDGTVVFAVAFTTAGDRLTYVTREGIRRSLRLTDLDVETTLRMNEERGTTLHLPT